MYVIVVGMQNGEGAWVVRIWCWEFDIDSALMREKMMPVLRVQ
jgi:hypothetical protein